MIVQRRVSGLWPSTGILFLLHPAVLGAQEASFKPGCMNPAHSGMVKGRVINDSTGLPAPRHGITLRLGNEACFALPDSTASFEVRNVPPGDYQLSVGDLTIRNFTPIPITVATDTVYVEVRVQSYDIVADCEQMPECVVLLTPQPRDGLRPVVDELLETGFRTAIAISIVKGGVSASWVPCVRGASTSILEALRQHFVEVVSDSECDMRSVPDGVLNKRMLHLPSGRSAYRVSFELLEASDHAASGYVSLSVAPLWGSGWSCDYTRGSDGWELGACQLRVQS